MSTKKLEILAKIKKIERYFQKLIDFQKISLNQLKQDENNSASLKWFLYSMLDSIISLLEIYISYKDYEIAASYQDNVDILLKNKEINQNQEELLRNIIGLRNTLSHDYEDLKLETIKNVIDKELKEVSALIDYFQNKL